MQIVIGALLGLALGSAAVAVLSVTLGTWACLGALVAGVLAGVTMRGVAGVGGSLYAKGGLAAVATAVAAIAGPLVTTYWFRAQGADTPMRSGLVVAETQSDAEGGESGEVAPVETPVVDRGGFTGGTAAPLRAPARDPFATADIACLVIGCLAAYQIGRGPEPVLPEEDEGATPEGDAAPQAGEEAQAT